jgi:hypothetical protein
VTPAKAATEVNLKLHKAPNLAAQITNAEWILSIPTAEKQKGFMLNCVQCHTLERILRSKHDAPEFLKVMERMGSYANQSFQYHPQKRMAMRMLEVRGEELDKTRQRQADFLAAHNLSTGATWPYDFKTLPRPKGSSTKVIITEYDLPRRTIKPHDRQDHRIQHSDPETGLADGRARTRIRSRRESMVRHDLPGRGREVRPEDRKVSDLFSASRIQQRHDADQHGGSAEQPRGWQILVPE